MKRTTASLCALVVVSVLVSTAVVIAADNNVGTWQLNLAKSNYSPGPAPKSQTLKIEAWGDDGVTYAADGVGADGKPTHTEFQAKYRRQGLFIQGQSRRRQAVLQTNRCEYLRGHHDVERKKHDSGKGRGFRGRQDANRDSDGYERAGPGP